METVLESETKQEYNELRWLADMYMQTQKLRIGVGNRHSAIINETDQADSSQAHFLFELQQRLEDVEDDIVSRMKNSVKTHPAWPWISKVKGLGPTLSTKILGLIPDIESFTTASKIWRYAGLAVIDGKAEKRTKGEKIHYNPRLKSTLYLVAQSMMRSNSPYRRVYDDAKTYYEAGRPDWTKGHIHNAALRKMEKVFLVHLWEFWREAEGFDARPLYVHEKLHHEMEYKREEFTK